MTSTSHMKAATISNYGPPEVLAIRDVPIPWPQANKVLVRVHAAAINPKDTFIRKGRFKRFTGRHFPLMTGFDFSGEVAAVGPGVMDTTVGESIYGMLDGWQGGACAEFAAVGTGHFFKKPEGLSFDEAAALPLVSLTALQALCNCGGIGSGMQVCINGASGGVGSMAVQIAKIMGAGITAVSSRQNHDFLKGLGADHCIDYRHGDIALGHPFDIFFDVFGNRPFRSVKPILSHRGVWVSTVIQPHVFLSVVLTRFFSRRKAKLVVVKSVRDDLEQVRRWVAAGLLRPIIHDVFPLEKIREAHVQQETKHTRGKIVIHIG
ncbi:NAD(P)-dependent alcohol dehydrogenase [uncultured Desulfosarcina sp.]|uniref:NAD(P)-dependent alcohol dehydrogenase n=1 Tax=uncultured Desulfosarcina sp. TaxID=218289 RepID=UPI0029C6ED19|nr:NAD(P)-dependent alcohol dehydrogenase [uncultured Desulfosarcina sp.]